MTKDRLLLSRERSSWQSFLSNSLRFLNCLLNFRNYSSFVNIKAIKEKQINTRSLQKGYSESDGQFISGRKLSIIVPTLNESGNITPLVAKIHSTLKESRVGYEVIFIDDHSTDSTVAEINSLTRLYPVKLHMKKGKRGKAFSLIEGFSYCNFQNICILDADLQYPPEAIPSMLQKILDGDADVVVAERVIKHRNILRAFVSKSFRYIFGRFLFGLDYDVQSGLKIFKKEIVERISLRAYSPWSFDIEFLHKSRLAGYRMGSFRVEFKDRFAGKAKISLIQSSLEVGLATLKLKFERPSAVTFNKNKIKEVGEGFTFSGRDYVSHSSLNLMESAFFSLYAYQKIGIASLFSLIILGLFANWILTLQIIVALLTVLYFVDLIFGFFLISRSFTKLPDIKISEKELKSYGNQWPRYTILCPLYKEWQVLPQFIEAMSALDYPKNKMQVLLLLEEDDAETLSYARTITLPEYFEVLVVPHSFPKTKPKACNFGLKAAMGEYVVIYDAEDVPDPLQLKKAVIAFAKSDQSTMCIQAKLNFYNLHQNLLTRLFTAEYSLWFDLVLTGLQSLSAPIPLGGTSNHFRTRVLKQVRGWDPFNVTEDCDMGIRLFKNGYKTAIVDSTTFEEANSDLKNWFWQRTRWIKGYIQTYFVHMRFNKDFLKEWGGLHWLTFQIMVGGKTISTIINPIMWTITVSYFLFRPILGPFIDSLYPAPILYLGVLSLIFGNFLYLYYYMIGSAKRGQYSIVKYAFLVPLYWLYMSAAAAVSIWKFVVDPFHWSKTKHGLHLKETVPVGQEELVEPPGFVTGTASVSL